MRPDSALLQVTLLQGTIPWFEMAGSLMCDAARASGLSTCSNVSLVERYVDGVDLSEGLIQGLRFEISAGVPSFRVGARNDETADIEIEITAAAARALNLMYSSDPRYLQTLNKLLDSGEMRVTGDIARLGNWVTLIHDAIVDRTA